MTSFGLGKLYKGGSRISNWDFLYLLSNFCSISGREDVQVGQERTGLQHPLVPSLQFFAPKYDVVLDSCVLDPGLLGHICHGALREQM